MNKKEALKEIEAHDLKAVRFSFADQHGVLRGKTLATAEVAAALERGVTVTSTLLLKDTSHRTVFPAFTPGGGIGIPRCRARRPRAARRSSTFRILPLGGRDRLVPVRRAAFRTDARAVLHAQPASALRCRSSRPRAYDLLAGLEVEFHVFRILDERLQPQDAGQPGTPPEVALLTTGYQLLTEHRYDLIDPVVELLRNGSRSSACRCAPTRSSSGRARWRSRSARCPAWPRPTQCSSSGARSSRSRGAMATTPPSCAGRNCPT
jgi:glutamine synthetase